MPIFERRKALGGAWTQYVQPVIDRYNDTEHSSIHEKPSVIAEHEYDFPMIKEAHESLMKQAKFPVKHESIAVGDHVKIRIKPKAFYKETFNSWSNEVYTVERVDLETPEGPTYHLQGYRRPLLRFELKKIEGVQRFSGGQLQSALHLVQHPQIAPVPVPGVPAAPRPPPDPIPRPITRSVSHAAAAAALAPRPSSASVAPIMQLPVRRPNTRSQSHL